MYDLEVKTVVTAAITAVPAHMQESTNIVNMGVDLNSLKSAPGGTVPERAPMIPSL